MKRANISELRDHLSRYLDHVRAGGHVIIFERNEPVAEIVPLRPAAGEQGSTDEARLGALERDGVIQRGAGSMPHDLLRGPLPESKQSVVDALLDERRVGR